MYRKVKIKNGWNEAGKTGVALGSEDFDSRDGVSWTSVLWDNEDDPDFHKTSGLEFIDEE